MSIRPSFGKLPLGGIFWNYKLKQPTELNVYRAARAALIFSRRTPHTLYRLVRSWLLFPVFTVTEGILPWLSYRHQARKVFDRNSSAQLMDILRLSVNDGPCGRKGYYLAGLAAYGGSEKLTHFIHDQLHECVVQYCRHAVELLYGTQPELNNKLALERQCMKFDLPCVKNFAMIDPQGQVKPLGNLTLSEISSQPALFVKPSEGAQGRFAERWNQADGSYTDSAGKRIESFAGFLTNLKGLAKSTGQSLLIQENVRNTAEIRSFGSQALSTVRLVTLRQSDKPAVLVQAGMRIGGAETAAVDNYHAGGMYFFVDCLTGKIGNGTMTTFAEDPVFRDSPPLSSEVLVDRQVPGWSGLCQLALVAHDKLTRDIICGWDIAVTDAGPVIVECNMVPGMPAPRQRPLDGFLTTRYSGLLRDQVLFFLRTTEKNGSRFRFS